MKQVDEMPTSGQFVAVFFSDFGIFSTTYMYENGNIYFFNFNVNNGDHEWIALDELGERELFETNKGNVIFIVDDETLN